MKQIEEIVLEPERYELQAAPLYHFEVDRREFFRVLGSDFFKTDRGSLVAEDGKILRKGSSDTVSFGQLAKGHQLVKSASGNAATVSPADWKIAGTSIAKVDGRAFVTGAHKYTSDIR